MAKQYTKMHGIETVAKTMMNYDNNRVLAFKAEFIPAKDGYCSHWKLSRLSMSNYPLGSKKWENI